MYNRCGSNGLINCCLNVNKMKMLKKFVGWLKSCVWVYLFNNWEYYILY